MGALPSYNTLVNLLHVVFVSSCHLIDLSALPTGKLALLKILRAKDNVTDMLQQLQLF